MFSFVLCVYSVSRLTLTVWNIIKGRKLSNDPITRSLNFVFYVIGHDEQTYDTYCNYVSFVFMGYLIISSVRSFSINIKNLFNFALRRSNIRKLETDAVVYVLALVYGVYFLTAVILLQNGLPRTYRYSIKYSARI